MRLVRSAITTVAVAVVVNTPFASAPVPRATLVAEPAIWLPGAVDSNSPVMWDLEDGQRRLFALTSYGGAPSISSGASFDELWDVAPVGISPHPGYGVWMEGVVSDDVDTWYGFYHNEWPATECGREDRAVAHIGAARSRNHGRGWDNLGAIISARNNTAGCNSANTYVIGGVGDLSVMLDADKQFLYFFYSQYPELRAAQGVAVARMAWADRDQPGGQLEIWRNGVWAPDTGRRQLMERAPGQTRRQIDWIYPFATPLVAPQFAWHDADDRVDAFWGPSVHWNTAIEQYVMLLNRANDENYAQEGIYVSFAPRLDDPSLWTAPQKILSGGSWYPQVIGLANGNGTDKLAGSPARFFMSGKSEWLIHFSK